jgi:hypothetical protein
LFDRCSSAAEKSSFEPLSACFDHVE